MRFNIPKSNYIKGFEWTGERIPYPEPEIKGDSYALTWTDTDEIIASAGDPLWGESLNGLDVEKFSGGALDYKITKMSDMRDYVGYGGKGPKPSGMICVDGVIYLAFQNLNGFQVPAYGIRSQHGSDAHIVYSTNKGYSWIPGLKNITKPMFPGNKFGGPAFINFGKNNQNARDEFVYAVSADQWDNGSNLRLGRAPKDHIIRVEKWEWVAAFAPDGKPAWTPHLEDSIPILSLHRWMSLPEMVYIAGINRYILLTWRLHQDFSADDGTDLIIFESPEPWGPFSLVHFEEMWEGQAFNSYCPRIPLKWLDSDGKSGWIQYSGSWGKFGQDHLYYRSNIRPFRFTMA
jgi:hypothetical protein